MSENPNNWSTAGAYLTAEAVCRYPAADSSTVDVSGFISPARYLNPDVEMGYRVNGKDILSGDNNLFVESFMQFFATGGEDSLAAVGRALPTTAKEWEAFIAGHDGTLAGMKEGLDLLVSDLKTLWDIFATWTQFLTDERLPIALLIDLWQGKLLAQDRLTQKLIEERFPGFSEAMRQAAMLWQLAGEELPKLVLA